jgi:hypothetical protein
MRLPQLVVATVGLTLCACTPERPPEFGVDVFSTDTIPAKISMTLTGTLQMGLRADQFYTTPTKALILETPASLIIQRGAGAAIIASLDTSQRIAVQPIGASPDSADALGAVGTVVRLTRVGEERRVKLEVERP